MFEIFCFEGYYDTKDSLKIYHNFKCINSSNNWYYV